MVESLVEKLLEFPEVTSVILTLNIPEYLNIQNCSRIKVLRNFYPKGFGSNHNAAFNLCDTPYFCVLNPDISLQNNPFAKLIFTFHDAKIGLVAPLVKNTEGLIEDSARHFLTLNSLLLRIFFRKSDSYRCVEGAGLFYPDWVAGMFMLFNSKIFERLKGFDEGYFLYVEDVDVCNRVWLSGYKVLINQNVSVIHDAQRASRRSFQHMAWHVKGLIRYFMKF